MPNLPNPFDSGENSALPSDEAAAFLTPQSSGAAADIPEPTSSTGGNQESPAPLQELVGAGDLGHIGEIFAGARKLFDPDPSAYTREDELYYDLLRAMDDPHTADLIDLPYGMEGIFDPPPLFLQIG
jgi:hypothetical protein